MFEQNLPLPKNDPQLFTPTHCRVLRSFCVGGQPLEPGATVTLQWCDFDSLHALGKVEILR